MIGLISTVFARQIGVGLLQIITLILIAKGLGSEQMGQYTLATLLPTLFSQFITFGLQTINIYAVGRRLINKHQALFANLSLLSLVSLVTIVILIIIVNFFGDVLFKNVPGELLYLSIAALFPQTFFTVLPSLLQAVENFKWFNLAVIVQAFILFVISMIAIFISQDVKSILIAYVISYWLTFFVLIKIVFKLMHVERCSLKQFLSDFLSYGLKSHLSNIITLLNYRSSLLVLGFFTSPVVVGIYTIGMQLVEKLWLPSQAVSTVLLPRLSNKLGEGNNEQEVAKLTLDVARMTFIITAVLGVFFALISKLVIIILFGNEYADAVYVILLLLPGILAWTPSRVLANDLNARGYAELNLYNACWVFSINLILSICFIPILGLIGAALATTIAYSMDLLLRLKAFNKVTGSQAFLNIIPKTSDIGIIVGFIKGLKK